jgi:hypothetical protein
MLSQPGIAPCRTRTTAFQFCPFDSNNSWIISLMHHIPIRGDGEDSLPSSYWIVERVQGRLMIDD